MYAVYVLLNSELHNDGDWFDIFYFRMFNVHCSSHRQTPPHFVETLERY